MILFTSFLHVAKQEIQTAGITGYPCQLSAFKQNFGEPQTPELPAVTQPNSETHRPTCQQVKEVKVGMNVQPLKLSCPPAPTCPGIRSRGGNETEGKQASCALSAIKRSLVVIYSLCASPEESPDT